ncbi:ATP-dependent DNA ligase [Humibacter ginsenosidimutans]|uniref:Probable DNA ligase n=1 Tax=Humibacter ginsenosidimutans TaxID=2599293 RepID=A0A5B8M3S4_9MICO|nr:ATP-dependent DNA ligase [Humibacter ginsenosidimutans]QDZ14230.1 ATP-dependent DNA ligase [Humibacter ginsenosidimutans]
MLLNELVVTSQAVAATRSRLAKVDALAALLSRLAPDEVVIAVGLLLGGPRQGRLGVGWRSAAGIDVAPVAVPALTLLEVDETFERLAAVSGNGSAATRADMLAGLMVRAAADEQRFLVHVLLGEMRTGALEGVLIDAIAAATGVPVAQVRRAAMLSGSLAATAALALGPDAAALADVSLRVGVAVRPMLAASAATVSEALEATGGASVEYKLDGARIQVHRDGDEVHVFTRSLADITHRVPEVVDAVRRLELQTAIFDGETLTLDEAGVPRPFQQTMSRFGADAAREALLRPWFFDLLHLDGRDLLDEPQSQRRAELLRVAPDLTIPGVTTEDPAVAEAFSLEALAQGHEGVVVKASDAPYTAGRRGSGWVKVKPVHTYDLVVLACEWGSGRRQGWLSNLHLGAYDPTGEFGDPGGFVMVGKTFKGLTDELLSWQTERFTQLEVRRTRGTVWVEPVTVVEIAIDGVQASPRYPGGIALRFARVKRYRDDKRADEADTIQTLRSLLRV